MSGMLLNVVDGMSGTLLNALGIVLGGLAGLYWRRKPAPLTNFVMERLLGVFAVYVGLKLTWTSLGPGWLVFKQLVIVVLALTLGRLTGQLLGLQKGFEHLYAKAVGAKDKPETPRPASEGFVDCTIVFCLMPLGFLGAVQNGLSAYWPTLGVKAVMDGMTAHRVVGTFRWSTMLTIIPLIAFQGTISLAARSLAPFLEERGLLNSVNATGGLLVFCFAMIILNFRKFKVVDYLPSLAYAPLITWLWK